jgi:uncharacterized protein YeaO (DUF488 family)
VKGHAPHTRLCEACSHSEHSVWQGFGRRFDAETQSQMAYVTVDNRRGSTVTASSTQSQRGSAAR